MWQGWPSQLQLSLEQYRESMLRALDLAKQRKRQRQRGTAVAERDSDSGIMSSASRAAKRVKKEYLSGTSGTDTEKQPLLGKGGPSKSPTRFLYTGNADNKI